MWKTYSGEILFRVESHVFAKAAKSQGAFRVRPTPKVPHEFQSCTPSGRRGANARKILSQKKVSTTKEKHIPRAHVN